MAQWDALAKANQRAFGSTLQTHQTTAPHMIGDFTHARVKYLVLLSSSLKSEHGSHKLMLDTGMQQHYAVQLLLSTDLGSCLWQSTTESNIQ